MPQQPVVTGDNPGVLGVGRVYVKKWDKTVPLNMAPPEYRNGGKRQITAGADPGMQATRFAGGLHGNDGRY